MLNPAQCQFNTVNDFFGIMILKQHVNSFAKFVLVCEASIVGDLIESI